MLPTPLRGSVPLGSSGCTPCAGSRTCSPQFCWHRSEAVCLFNRHAHAKSRARRHRPTRPSPSDSGWSGCPLCCSAAASEKRERPGSKQPTRRGGCGRPEPAPPRRRGETTAACRAAPTGREPLLPRPVRDSSPQPQCGAVRQRRTQNRAPAAVWVNSSPAQACSRAGPVLCSYPAQCGSAARTRSKAPAAVWVDSSPAALPGLLARARAVLRRPAPRCRALSRAAPPGPPSSRAAGLFLEPFPVRH